MGKATTALSILPQPGESHSEVATEAVLLQES